MTAETLLADLFEQVPEIERAVRRLLRGYGVAMEDGRFTVWEYGVMECVEVLLEEAKDYHQTLERIFQFFERMATGDEDTRNFLLCSTMDFFYEKQELLPVALQYMGPETKAAWEIWYQFQREIPLWQLAQLYSEDELAAMGKA